MIILKRDKNQCLKTSKKGIHTWYLLTLQLNIQYMRAAVKSKQGFSIVNTLLKVQITSRKRSYCTSMYNVIV